MVVRGFKVLSTKDTTGVEEVDLSVTLNDDSSVTVTYKDDSRNCLVVIRNCTKDLDSVIDAIYDLVYYGNLVESTTYNIDMSKMGSVIGNSNYGGCIGMSSHFTISIGLDITDEEWMFTLQRIKSTYNDSVRELILFKDKDIKKVIIKGMLVLINKEQLKKLQGGISKSISEIIEFRRN